VILATHTAGEGSTVVLLHGLFGSARNLGGVARALAATHRVLSLDMRNHGDSPHDPAVDYDIMAADVMQTLDAAGALPAALLGHSMGGKVAMRLALTDPTAVTRLLVADIAPVPNPPNFSAFTRAMLAVPPQVSRQQADAMLAPDVPDPAVRSFLLHNFRSGAGWRIGLPEIAAALPRIEGWDPVEASYAGPTLFVTGARSRYVLPEHRPAIHALFPAARFVAIKDAGHWLHAEQPAAFNATAAAFFANAGL
jgi:pimeloyl-ACP methyl ester carboxylesterase